MNPAYLPIVDDARRVVAHDLFDVMPNGNSIFVFRFDGFYGDLRDVGVFSRMAALPALIAAAKDAAHMIESIQEEFKETASGNTILWRLKTAFRAAQAVVDTNYWNFDKVKDEEERFECFHELDGAAVTLVEASEMAALQIEYLADKFGAKDWEAPVAAVAAAVKLSEGVEPHFENDDYRQIFEEWRTTGAAALEAARARFGR